MVVLPTPNGCASANAVMKQNARVKKVFIQVIFFVKRRRGAVVQIKLFSQVNSHGLVELRVHINMLLETDNPSSRRRKRPKATYIYIPFFKIMEDYSTLLLLTAVAWVFVYLSGCTDMDASKSTELPDQQLVAR